MMKYYAFVTNIVLFPELANFYFRIWQVFTSLFGRILLPVLAGYYFRSWQAFTFHVWRP
jgi:hypothetical protein